MMRKFLIVAFLLSLFVMPVGAAHAESALDQANTAASTGDNTGDSAESASWAGSVPFDGTSSSGEVRDPDTLNPSENNGASENSGD